MRVIVAGGRDFEPTPERIDRCKAMLVKLGALMVLSGKADGADQIGELAAEELGLPVEDHPADWDTYKLAAGPKRNKEMAEVADALLAFPGGRGTSNMINEMRKLGKKIYHYGGDK